MAWAEVIKWSSGQHFAWAVKNWVTCSMIRNNEGVHVDVIAKTGCPDCQPKKGIAYWFLKRSLSFQGFNTKRQTATPIKGYFR